MQENRKDIGDFDKVLDTLYGKPGTPERSEFRREAYSYCVGSIIHDARKREKMTQQELAERVGTTKSYISRIETGNVEPSAGLFLNILSTLGLSIVSPIR
ncbi:MAG: helix-turn-helix transcriptional regulator [Bacteroidales bacterium]|jgi:DNA-binding XRE family transcriptional regulator|nr:helix-turn-helix transcriptional regulator [Bacteroidales bacterium]